MPSHHVRLPPKNVVRPLDWQARKHITACELFSQVALMADHIVEMRHKTGKSVRSPEAA
jgi:hypothetical protein